MAKRPNVVYEIRPTLVEQSGKETILLWQKDPNHSNNIYFPRQIDDINLIPKRIRQKYLSVKEIIKQRLFEQRTNLEVFIYMSSCFSAKASWGKKTTLSENNHQTNRAQLEFTEPFIISTAKNKNRLQSKHARSFFKDATTVLATGQTYSS